MFTKDTLLVKFDLLKQVLPLQRSGYEGGHLGGGGGKVEHRGGVQVGDNQHLGDPGEVILGYSDETTLNPANNEERNIVRKT